LVDFPIALLAFSSTFCNEVSLCPKRVLLQYSNGAGGLIGFGMFVYTRYI